MSDRHLPDRITLCGIAVDNVTMEQAIGRIAQLVARRTPSCVVTPNVDVLVKLRKDREFRRIYANAALVIPDGMPLLWAAKFLGRPLQEKVSGSDLFVRLCETAAKKGWRVFLMGARPGVAQKAAEILAARYPGLVVCGTYSPSFGLEKKPEESEAILRMLDNAKPDVLFVGLGSPKQEKWLDRHRAWIRVPVSMGVGISFDYVAGTVKRAPLWMQRSGLEWFGRLCMEPRRLWKRYLVDDPIFFWLVLKQKFSKTR